MNNDEYDQKYKNNIFAAAQALRNKFRQQIFSELTNKNSLSFNDLKNILNLPQPKLAYHIQILIKYNIIINFYDKRENVKDHSFYELSAFGRELIIGSSRTSTDILYDESELNEPLSSSANFRTINHVEYKSYENIPLKIKGDSVKPIEDGMNEYIDPLLGCNIKNNKKVKTKTKKIQLPTYRQYYLLHKHSFSIQNDIDPKY